ncbi:MAG: sigma-70 family RNA polymerase sigma factor [Acidobacteriaceae bacterium]|nr:sigma-70 family RNA polymerase sigma factor [Acidobacteriaceae bacterium]
MSDQDWLAQQFERNRGNLRAVAYRMLGSLGEAEDAVQEAWLRLARSDAQAIENLGAWLTTVISRVCLDLLRSRNSRREESLEQHLPDMILGREDRMDPEQETLIADSVGLALLIVLDTLAPNERLAFVLHDMFAVPFEEIAFTIGCSPVAARQLASRARRRVRGAAPRPDADLSHQRKVVDAFLAAERAGDFDGLVAVLDPEVVLRSDYMPGGLKELRGAGVVAQQAIMFSKLAGFVQPVLVNGTAGIVSWRPDGQPFSVMGFTVSGGKIIEIDVLRDPARLSRLNLRRLKH